MAAMRVGSGEGVAKPTRFDELIPATVVLLFWVVIVAKEGWNVGLDTAWAFLIVLPLAGWTLLMRLRYSPSRFRRTIGPLRNEVDLAALQSIKWKMTGGWRSQGTIFVSDRHGGRVPIYVGRFAKVEEWGPLLIEAAERSSAAVDQHSRTVLLQRTPA
jgi:hypothetical protein